MVEILAFLKCPWVLELSWHRFLFLFSCLFVCLELNHPAPCVHNSRILWPHHRPRISDVKNYWQKFQN